ncbi:cap-specific mRNA (nucleoside-2'-O-)-methyltransferase 1-like isoform X1 [Rhynchophorus ferrugineus]|uniref:cap-specific mRNA (nucleoside-2'-O-)-methyltransferase 1-like isoform X1 n=2 Tax=Rhynchophorus ferrugineus TaxID=354439 RepID=UPI003FCE93F9
MASTGTESSSIDNVQRQIYDKNIFRIYEKANWIKNSNADTFSLDKCRPIEGPKMTSVDDTKFCDLHTFREIFEKRDLLERFSPEDIYEAKLELNPFETVKSEMFMSKEATKLANIDAATDFMLTNMEKQGDFPLPICFADVCGGPGAFSEYLLWKRDWDYKGFGITLQGPDDFKLENSKCTSFASFQKLYGVGRNGDVCNPTNIRDFASKAFKEADGGVHLVLSDGSLPNDVINTKYNLQEIYMKHLYVCQCYLALLVLRPHGSLLLKLFDVFTPFSAGLLYLMYICFERVSILKPVTSCASNSERYFICNDLRGDTRTKAIGTYLGKVVDKLWSYRSYRPSPGNDILEIVPLDVIMKNTTFYEYLFCSNIRIAHGQLNALTEMLKFCENTELNRKPSKEQEDVTDSIANKFNTRASLVDSRSKDLCKICLNYFDIPYSKTFEQYTSSPRVLKQYHKELKRNIPRLDKTVIISTLDKLKNNYSYCFLEYGLTGNFYFAKDNKVYEMSVQCEEKYIQNLYLENGTFVYGELVKEGLGFNLGIESRTLHIIDAVTLGTVCLDGYTSIERLQLITRYCKAINKESQLHKCCRLSPKVFKNLNSLSLKSFDAGPAHTLKTILIYNNTDKTFLGRFNRRYHEQININYITPILEKRNITNPLRRPQMSYFDDQFNWSSQP